MMNFFCLFKERLMNDAAGAARGVLERTPDKSSDKLYD